MNEGKSVAKKVTKHGVTAPATEDTDFIRVNAPEEQGHGTAGRKGPCRDIIRVDSGVTWNGERGSAQETCDHGARDGPSSVLVVKVGMQRSSCGRVMGFKVCYSPKKWLTIRGVSHLLTFDTILLCGEGERYIGS